jgi:hypothetical protein
MVKFIEKDKMRKLMILIYIVKWIKLKKRESNYKINLQ